MTYMDVTAVAGSSLPNGMPVGMVNFTDGEFATEDLEHDPQLRQIASQLSSWVNNARNARGHSSMFDRGVYTPPENPYEEMRAARNALRYDSIVSGVAEVTESFAFQGVKWEGSDSDEADVFNQIAGKLKLDEVIRRMWREEFSCAQFVCAKLWGWNEYTPRGVTDKGNKKKKRYRVWAPQRLIILDSLKCVPVGSGPLREDLMAWQATPFEIGTYMQSYRGDKIDPLMVAFFEGTYIPDEDETAELAALGVDPARLLLMNPEWVFRHTDTRPDYQKFADIRLKSVFKLLDLKNQLMQADRASLIGAANYILLIKKGDKDTKATPTELDNLRENYKSIAKLPVIISDHRLEIEIIAPKVDLTLNSEKYDVLDQRILNRLLGSLSAGAKGGARGEGESNNLATSVARVVQNRRHMIARSIEHEIAEAIVNHPKNRGLFKTEPNLVYTPRNISLSSDSSYGQALLALRMSREISRDSILEYFGLDQETEFIRLQLEEQFYDDVFKTILPFSGEGDGSTPASGQPGGAKKTPNGTAEAPAVSGARGGRPKGGGSSPKSPTATAKPRTSTGAPKTGK